MKNVLDSLSVIGIDVKINLVHKEINKFKVDWFNVGGN